MGESVKVIDGPFNGFTGAIEKVNEEKRKLEVMVKDLWSKDPSRVELYASRKIINVTDNRSCVAST